MQQINANVSLSGSGGATLLDGWRDAQTAMRALQRINGQIGGTGTEAQSARPVLAVSGTDRSTLLTAARPEITLPLEADRDAPTGPRPTFEHTPLERLRSDVMDPSMAKRRATPELHPTLALGRWDAALSKTAFSESDGATRSDRVQKTDVRLDVRT